jgi:flagellar hook-length control protein FliK
LAEGDAPPTETQSARAPVSSNAVAPNFAATLQAQAPAEAAAKAAGDSARPVPMESLAIEIAARAKNGQRHFEIRLDPPELGKIEVRIETDTKGNSSTRLVAERPETLDLLQRDARGLEKALQNAGLKLDSAGLSFSLRQDSAQTHAQQNHDTRRPLGAAAEEIAEPAAVQSRAYLAAKVRGGVDIRI